jgi:hypothetical protein
MLSLTQEVKTRCAVLHSLRHSVRIMMPPRDPDLRIRLGQLRLEGHSRASIVGGCGTRRARDASERVA